MKALLIGHSHSVCIMRAVTEAARTEWEALSRIEFEHVHLRRHPYEGLLYAADGQPTSCGRILAQKIAPADALVLSLEGNYHNAMGMVERRARFDFYGDPGQVLPMADRQLIPRAIMEEIFIHKMSSPLTSSEGIPRASLMDILKFVRETSGAPCALLESPPPVPDAGKIAHYRPTGDDCGIPPLSIRTKLWRLQCSLVQRCCARFRIDYLPVPAEVFGPDGNLDPRAYEGVNDPTHMNTWYGRFVARQIDSWLAKSALRPADSRKGAMA